MAPEVNWPRVVSFYTDDEVYRPAADRLRKSLEKFGIPYCLVKIPRLENYDWCMVAKLKPSFILEQLEEWKNPIFWLDADNEVIQEPKLFKHIGEFDIAVSRFDRFDWMLNSSTIGFNYTPVAREILREWTISVPRCRNGKYGDQPTLHRVLQRFALAGGRVGMLPTTYISVDKANAVIYQHHAGIECRKIYG